jgi:phage terminase Nu1 subunit (DNA packaging protein)
MPIVTKAEFARLQGISRARVSQLTNLGMPTLPDGRVDVAVARRWIRKNILPAEGGRSSARLRGDSALMRARTATEVLKARERRFRVERLEAELVPAAEIAPTVAAAFGRVRERCQRFIADAAPVLASIDDPAECEATLDRMVRELLDELAATEVTVRGQGGDHAS